MRKLATIAMAVACLAPGAARAQLVPGVRLGYALAGGDLIAGTPLKDALKSQIPIQLELGWRLAPRFTVGAYGSWGAGQVGDLCSGSASCSGSVIDMGVQATYGLDLASFDPWVGVGLGYEWAGAKVKEGGDEVQVNVHGFELVRLMAGVDFTVGGRFAVGPFVQWGLGRYSYLEVKSPLGNASGAPSDPAQHSWFTVGVRGTFEPSGGDAAAAARKAEEDRLAQKAEADRAAATLSTGEATTEASRAAAERAAAERAAADAKAEADRAAAARATAEANAAEAGRVAAAPAAKPLAVVTDKAIEILQPVQFETGKAVIRRESLPVLREVAGVLGAHPEIKKVVVEGHTDDVGSAPANTRISEQRAQAVRQWLAGEGGVAAARLDAKGFGPARPIADNATPEGRARNRRVEFRIVK